MAEHIAEPERPIDILAICDEWKPSKGGLSAFNRELVINLAKESRGKVNVHCYVSESDEADREDAKKNGVNLVTAQKIPGTANPHEWLKFPPPEIPNVDVVIGHGRKFGLPAYFIKKFIPSKLLQFVHVYCPDLGKYKTLKRTANCLRPDTIDENEGKHADEKELCEVADAVVAVGPALQQKYQRDLADIDVQVFTPCISASFLVNQPPRWQGAGAEGLKDFTCLVCGRADFEDRELKGYDVIANAIGSLGKKFQLKFVGSPACKQRKLEKWFLKNTNITREQLTICRFVDQSQLKKLFCSSDVVVLPSRVEGFGLVALEAISADTNVLVSKQAGISQALQTVEGANCVIVESHDDPNEWANKIRQLSNQTVQERREKAICLRENYAKTYSSQEECQKLLSLIETLVNRGMWTLYHHQISHVLFPNKVSSLILSNLQMLVCTSFALPPEFTLPSNMKSSPSDQMIDNSVFHTPFLGEKWGRIVMRSVS